MSIWDLLIRVEEMMDLGMEKSFEISIISSKPYFKLIAFWWGQYFCRGDALYSPFHVQNL